MGQRTATTQTPVVLLLPNQIVFLPQTPRLEEYGDIPDPEADPDFGDMMDWSERRRRSLALSRRNNLNKRWPCLTCAIKAVGNFIAHPVDTLVALKDEIQQATSISGSVNKDLTFKVPDPANVEASRLQDPNAKQVTSPWGDSILLKSFGTQPESEGGDSKKRDEKEKALSGYMNVFCVGCGVSGHASVAGRASWTPLGGFIEGQVEMRADVQFVFKLGIDAQMTYSKEFNNNLLRLGLPGLTYGVVTIGPWVEVGSTVKLDAEAKGRLLAGAEMGLQNAHVLIDFINPSKSTKDGWEPYFKPVFEADGELMLSASLGLPFGLKCGLQVASFSKSVGLVDEPSIKGIAQVAASIGLASSGGFVAGFKDSNDCTGISTQISWRNKLYVDVLGLTQLSLLDTDDKPLAQGCIALPGLPSPLPSKSTDATTSAPTPTGIEESDSESSQTPTVGDDSQPSETESPNVEPTTTPSNDDESDPISGTDSDISADDNSDAPTDQDGSGDGDDSGAVPEDVSSEDSSHDVVKRHSLVSRGTNSTNSTVRDITSKVKSNITTLSYETTSLPDHPYNDTAGYEYNLLTVPDGSIIFISCGNGAIYAVSPDGPDNPSCTPNWETYNDVIVADGADRIMHYYSHTMEAVGVSRLRVSNQQSVPEKGTIVAFIADDSDEDTSEDGGYFAALDPDMNVFYPVLCTYSDGNPARMFLAADPEKGPEILQSEDLEYSITGGKVDKCYTMPLLMGQWADDSEGYTSYNDSPSDDDDLDYDWDGYDWDQE
ncbi:hypothetical protein UCRPA7_8026 [Phaeoacremonium minimum UCRPA7]|uniref:Uncharacterized protein n=1 Tax=Phaeoacremonium minimum (strain UCR-PA7) TaxID=1286976 RepID=R8BB30_PHAM7|nr:hypothetical protein UCRPA7_8026 [Phaeoacremonium minimum UCRPA7]EON96487.1 hypothetical protein UCRPA7_8026 [Phaeoacremonium minimum UCRPA7]